MSRKIGKKGLDMIKKYEGCRLEAYQDVIGVWTIGYGHTAGVRKGMKITQEKANTLLIEDCQKFANYVDNPSYVAITSKLNENQRDALISFSYNCGQGNLKKLCKNRTASEISKAIPLYNKAGGNIVKGLVNRRKSEQELFNLSVTKETTVKKETAVKKETKSTDFVLNIKNCLNIKSTDSNAEMLSKTITVSNKTNSKHKVVKSLQAYLSELGYDEVGAVDGIAGAKFKQAVEHYQLDKKLMKKPDGIISARKKTWKSLLGL